MDLGRAALGPPLSVRGHAHDKEIAAKRNAAIGAVEAMAYGAVALLVTGL
jgi:hypothetical protein